MKIRKQKRITGSSRHLFVWACSLSVLLCMNSQAAFAAAGPGQEEREKELSEAALYEAVDGYQIPEEERVDSVIEYRELGSLIYYYNSSVREIVTGTEDSRTEYTEIRDYLRNERDSAHRDKEDAEDSGNMEDYVANSTLEEIYRSGVKSYNDSIKRLDQYSFNRNRIVLERQLTSAAQSLMISMQSLRLQQNYLGTAEELYHALYDNQTVQFKAGLSTGQTVQAAYNNWTSARNSLESLADSESQIYQNLCLLLGVDENGSMTFGALPDVDFQKIDAIELEKDVERAVNNNSEMINLRRTNSDGGSSGIRDKKRKVDALEKEIRIEVQRLHGEIIQTRQAYEAAATGFSGAKSTWSNAQTKYSMGMLSYAEYLQEEMSYIRKETDCKTAELNLFQAVQDYEWAVAGI
ncbi:TolC family protein [Clostridium transplantifaecale]|uniref:TolC family protein n=1 Tax=Clostridium transplantifaecale TaxID=2479838 RepID=UPI000F633C33|nr:TolC family protein [Clostridium transplantifaecale]